MIKLTLPSRGNAKLTTLSVVKLQIWKSSSNGVAHLNIRV